MPTFIKILFVALFLLASFILVTPAFSNSNLLDDINKKLNDLNNALNQSRTATAPLESQLKSMQKQIADIKAQVAFIENDITTKRKTIEKGYKELTEKKELFNQAVQKYYIKSYYNSPLLVFLSAKSATELNQALAYQKAATDQDKVLITNIALSINDLEEKKAALENEQSRLTVVKANLDKQSAELDKIVSGAKAYQATLSSEIAQLTAQQQQLLAQKLGSLNLPKSAYSMKGGCTDDRNIDPGFSPRFAMFTYGVPNRVGMNQFGAWGRAKAGQNDDAILRAYYNFDGYQNVDTNINIRVNDGNGFNTGNIIWSGGLEDYIKRIYEVPDSWIDNDSAVLKAQAVAARSYVLAATNNGASSICANEYCQAFQTNPKGGNWESAVNATSGKIMVLGGQPIKAWYSSTHGGYAFASGDIGWNNTSWTKRVVDATGSINSFADLQSNAYDKDSPIFYCDWGSRAQYNKTAWMKPDEVADIANVILLVRKDSSTSCFVYQPDKAPPPPDASKGCSQTDNWSPDKVKSELKSRGITPFNAISDVSVSADFGSGTTTSITLSGDGKSENFNGSEFKNWFNVRAPSNINIVGPLYNVEKK